MEKEELLLSLDDILNSETTIKNHVDRVFSIRQQLDLVLNDEEKFELTSKIKARVQKEAKQFWDKSPNKGGAILMATGVGKSKIGIDVASAIAVHNEDHIPSILIVVPTEKLRDEGWKEEFTKWGERHVYDFNVTRCCYASLSKYDNFSWDLVIMDEGHNITENNAEFFKQNEVKKVLWLSATKPKDATKIQLLKQLNINPIYEITLDEAVKLGLVAPYNITVVTVPLDRTEKYLKAGNKDHPFYNTELNQYNYLSRICIAAPAKHNFLKRMRFIYNLKSKTLAAKWILEHLVPKDDYRTLIFSGSKKQANELCEYRFYSKPSKPKAMKDDAKPQDLVKYAAKLKVYTEEIVHYQGDGSYQAFREKQISKLACVDALNEGHNIPDVDCGLIAQLNSNEKNLWQRIGRVIRFRPGHTGTFVIICAKDTEDEKWTNNAIANLDGANIKWVTLEDLQSGKETITF